MNGSGFLHDHHVLSSKINSMPLLSASGGLPSALLQDLLEPDIRLQRSSLHESQVMKNKSSIDYHQQLLPPKQQTQFSDRTPFWDPSESSVTEAHSSYCNNPFAKANSGVGVSFPTLEKKGGGEPAGKKPRIEKPSPLPTFKVSSITSSELPESLVRDPTVDAGEEGEARRQSDRTAATGFAFREGKAGGHRSRSLKRSVSDKQPADAASKRNKGFTIEVISRSSDCFLCYTAKADELFGCS
ncbi:hypothetical protein BHM03_00006009 [Ensete ventricosum]|nr:hypothetical protein BHM03_00006009 [Ensete ventricosum]